MYLIYFWCKSGEITNLGIAASKKEVWEIVDALNYAIGYESGIGIWSQDCPGRYGCEEIPLVPAGELMQHYGSFLKVAK